MAVEGVSRPAPGLGRARPLRRLAEYGGFAPAMVLLGAFFFAPLGLIVVYSFWQVHDYNVVSEWTLGNYGYFFSTPTYVRTLLSTLLVAALATAIAIGLAFPFAYWLVRHVAPRWQKPLLVLVLVPFWTSYLLRVYSWISILGEQGAINRVLRWTGVIDEPLSYFLYDRPAVVLVLVYLYFPFAALTLYAVLERFDWNQLRAATDLGASPLRAIRSVMLPQVRVGIMTAVIFVFIPILGEYLAPQLVGGTRGVMIGNLITTFFTGAQYTRGAAAALLVVAVIVALLIVFRRSLDTEQAVHSRGTRMEATGLELVSPFARLASRALSGYAVALYAFLFAPIALLVLFSFNASRFAGFPITGWTTRWYGDMFANAAIHEALVTSLVIAAQVTVVSTIVGTAAAFPLVRSRLRFRGAARILVTLPVMVPGLLIGVSLLALFTSVLGMQLSMQTAAIGQAVFTTPFVILLVAARLEGFDVGLERAASDLGAGTWRRLRHVVLPLTLPAIVAGALFAFTLSLDEFIITLFLLGGHNTLPIYIYTQVKFGITPEVNALATALLAASLAIGAIAFSLPGLVRRVVARRRRRRAADDQLAAQRATR